MWPAALDPDPADQRERADADGRRAGTRLRAALDPGAADQAEARRLDPDPRRDGDPGPADQRHRGQRDLGGG